MMYSSYLLFNNYYHKLLTGFADCVCSCNASLCEWRKATTHGRIQRQIGKRPAHYCSQSAQLLSQMFGKTARCRFWSV